jgi:SNF2 family DNA or RNA helicase
VEDVKLIDEAQQPIRYKNIDQLKIQLSFIASFVKKSDCLDLPEKIYQEIVLPASSEQKKIINDMKKYAVALYGNRELTIQHKALLQVRALQVCGGFFPHLKDVGTLEDNTYSTMPLEGKNSKLEFILKDIEELGNSSFIVWAVFVPELELLLHEISKVTSVVLLAGSTPKSQRDAIVEKFKSGEYQGLVANPEVAGYGFNFQHASIQYWYSRNYRTESRLQAEDRSHRIGTTASPIYKDLVYDIQFEKSVLKNNKEGREMSDYFNSTTISELLSL